jgi:PIN domain nuclease of toxin-antitoxin system
MAQNKQPLLLDSHVFIWALEQVEKLGEGTRQLLESGGRVYVSKVTLWELAIKYKAEKFPYNTSSLLEGLESSGFSLLDIAASHLEAYSSVRLPHKDPFDSLLIAQAITDRCMFITADRKLLDSAYAVHDAYR